MKKLMKHLSNPILILNNKGHVKYGNQAMEILCSKLQTPISFFTLENVGLTPSKVKSGSEHEFAIDYVRLPFSIFRNKEQQEEEFVLLFSKSAVVTALIDDILDVVEDIVIITDKYGVKRHQNSAAHKFFEEIQDLGNLDINQPIYFRGISQQNNPVTKAISTKTTTLVNITYENEQTITYTCTPTFDPDDQVKYVIVTGQNITQILKDEKKLQKIIDEEEYSQKQMHFITKEGKLLIIGDKMAEIVNMAERIGPSNISVLLEGETGVGKELFARLIHSKSKRADTPFVAINCAAIAANLLEAELFGYEDGSFTDAKKGGKKGLLEMANGGTIFLDEIGELPLEMQAKLLRVIQDGTFLSIGSTVLKKVDIRYISATNVDLEKSSTFRKDLYHRLSVVKLYIPSLRERQDNILPLVEAFVEEFNKEYNKNVVFSEDIEDFLMEYNWPGNIRQLKNIIKRVIILSDTNVPTIEEVKDIMNISEQWKDGGIAVKGIMSMKKAYQLLEEAMVAKAAEDKTLSVKEIAQLLDVAPSTLYRKNLDYILKNGRS